MKLTQLGSLYKLIRRESRTMRKSVAKQPRQRASAFVLESLENRVLLSATPMDVPTTEPVVTAAVVTTDKADYAPGETALITTSNTSADGLKFGDGELVQFQVTRTDGIPDSPMGNLPWYVTDGVGGFNAYQEYDANGQAVDRNADGLADLILPDNDLTVNGSISTNWFVEDQYLGASLLLTATGRPRGPWRRRSSRMIIRSRPLRLPPASHVHVWKFGDIHCDCFHPECEPARWQRGLL